MNECVSCVMDTVSDPQITFDEKGVCNYCHAAMAKKHQHKVDTTNFPWIIDGIRKSGMKRKYACVLGLSGGVDSSYALHILKQNGINVFTYTIDNGWNTPEADENIMRLVEGMRVPFYRYSIDREKFKHIQGSFIISGVKNIEIPSDHLITSVAWEMAKQEGVKTIVSGGNWQTESIMPDNFGYSAVDLHHINRVHGAKVKGLPTTNLAQYMWYRMVKKIKIVNILDYVDYNREAAQRKLSELYGWKPYGAKHEESIFTKWFQDWYLPQIHKLDKRRPHLSSMIHSGQMTREQAEGELRKPLMSYEEGRAFLIKHFGMAGNTIVPVPHKVYGDHERLRRWAHKIYKHF